MTTRLNKNYRRDIFCIHLNFFYPFLYLFIYFSYLKEDIVAVVEEIRYGCGASLTNVSSRCCVCIPPLDANYAVFSAISIPRPNVRFLRNRRTPDATISEVSYPQQVWRRSPTLIYMRPLLYPLPIPLPFFPPLWAFPLPLPLLPPF